MDEEREIRNLQIERGKSEGRLASFNAIQFDTEFYDTDSKGGGKYNTTLDEDEEDDPLARKMREHTESDKKSFLNSFTGTKYVNDTRSKDDFDPFKETKRKTIADREDSYRARWRKRKLSPPQVDPFKKGSGKESSETRTYKEIMQDVLLDKEKQEVLMKIKKKKQDEELEKMKAGQRKSSGWDVNESGEKKTPPAQPSQAGWKLDIFKDGEKLNTLHIEADITYNIGRDGGNEIVLEHQSISKKHAKITFMNNRPNLMDLNSTNGTKLNGDDITPGTYYKLAEGDKIVFGCSTREYKVRLVD